MDGSNKYDAENIKDDNYNFMNLAFEEDLNAQDFYRFPNGFRLTIGQLKEWTPALLGHLTIE